MADKSKKLSRVEKVAQLRAAGMTTDQIEAIVGSAHAAEFKIRANTDESDEYFGTATRWTVYESGKEFPVKATKRDQIPALCAQYTVAFEALERVNDEVDEARDFAALYEAELAKLRKS